MAESTGAVIALSPEQVEKGSCVTHLDRIWAKPASLPPMEKETSPVEESRWSSWAGSPQDALGW